MKKIGIIGGISSASTLHYYKTLHDLFYNQYHQYYYPEIVIDSLNFQYFTDLENENRMDEYKQYAVGQKAKDLGLKKLLLTGIGYTMRRNFYQIGF